MAEATRFYKVSLGDLFVFHDELDLAAGKVRVKRGGGAAGHNGLRSIDAHLGTDYWRVRLGIGRPDDKRRVLGHVLDDFDEADRRWLDPMLTAVAEQTPLLVAGDAAAFASKVALALNPPRPKPTRLHLPAGEGVVASPSPHPSPQGEGNSAEPSCEREGERMRPSPRGEAESKGGEPSPHPSPGGRGSERSEWVRESPAVKDDR